MGEEEGEDSFDKLDVAVQSGSMFFRKKLVATEDLLGGGVVHFQADGILEIDIGEGRDAAIQGLMEFLFREQSLFDGRQSSSFQGLDEFLVPFEDDLAGGEPPAEGRGVEAVVVVSFVSVGESRSGEENVNQEAVVFSAGQGLFEVDFLLRQEFLSIEIAPEIAIPTLVSAIGGDSLVGGEEETDQDLVEGMPLDSCLQGRVLALQKIGEDDQIETLLHRRGNRGEQILLDLVVAIDEGEIFPGASFDTGRPCGSGAFVFLPEITDLEL